MALNVTTAVIGSGCNTATATPSLAQWDVGQVLKIEGVDLPAAYQVDFSTEYTRNAIQKIGNAAGVAIPNELLQRSAPITAYIVLHEGENDRETEYWITIHITPRTPPETITPDPEEQSVIDETIAALQAGVAAAEAAAESVQNMGVEAETLTPGSPLTVTKEVDPETGAVTLIFGLTQGPKGDDGYSPTITITTITGGHRFTVTDKTHPSGQSFDVLDGTKGDKGDDGYSPVITITTITGGHRFTVTDKTHPSGQSFDVLDGAKGDQGDDGYSPVVTITTITGGHRVTITDKTHPSGQTFDVMDGVIQSVNGKSAASITLDSGDIEFDDSATYQDGTVGKELSDQKNAIGELNRQLNDETTGLDTKAPVIINTASGAIASFDDGADSMPINSLVAQIEPVQDLHGYENPWPAGGGKNKFGCADGTYAVGSTRTITVADSVWSYKVNSAATSSVFLPDTTVTAMGVPALKAGTYTFSLASDTAASSVIATAVLNLSDGQAITNGNSFTISADTSVVSITTPTSGQYATGSYTCNIQIESGTTVTEWTPYSNICPISGHTGLTVARTGKNLYPYGTIQAYTYAWYSGSKALADATNPVLIFGGKTYVLSWVNSNDDAKPLVRVWRKNGELLENEPTVLNMSMTNQSGSMFAYNNVAKYYNGPSSSNVNSAIINPTEDLWLDMRVQSSRGVSTNTQLEIGQVKTDYEAYNSTTIPITFPTTIYGGSDEVIGGALESMLKSVDMGTLEWFASGQNRFYAVLADTINSTNNTTNFYCDRYVPRAVISNGSAWINQQRIFIVDDSYATAADFKAAMSGAQLVYPLATPLEYTLTQNDLTTLLGKNNVWTDVGEVSVDYPADTKLYIDNKIATAIANALNA